MSSTLSHHGIKGQQWGVRNGPPYPLGSDVSTGSKLKMNGSQSSMDRKDAKWQYRQSRTTTKKVQRQVEKSKRMKEYDKYLKRGQFRGIWRNKDGTLNKNYIAYRNQFMAEEMNKAIKDLDLRSPSGMVLAFVAKRGEIGVHTAIASADYDLSQLRRGVNSQGKVAYQQKYVEQQSYEERRRR